VLAAVARRAVQVTRFVHRQSSKRLTSVLCASEGVKDSECLRLRGLHCSNGHSTHDDEDESCYR
jgi:hypothetical protein